jgi:hypothetical protein
MNDSNQCHRRIEPLCYRIYFKYISKIVYAIISYTIVKKIQRCQALHSTYEDSIDN